VWTRSLRLLRYLPDDGGAVATGTSSPYHGGARRIGASGDDPSMLRIDVSKPLPGVFVAIIAAISMSCSTADEPFTSVGRGAPLEPAIPAETWVEADNHEAFPPDEIEGYPERY
jgi:hypothetical protein